MGKPSNGEDVAPQLGGHPLHAALGAQSVGGTQSTPQIEAPCLPPALVTDRQVPAL